MTKVDITKAITITIMIVVNLIPHLSMTKGTMITNIPDTMIVEAPTIDLGEGAEVFIAVVIRELPAGEDAEKGAGRAEAAADHHGQVLARRGLCGAKFQRDSASDLLRLFLPQR